MEISPDKNLKNKFYHMMHYYIFMIKFGPLRHFSSLRAEDKHRLGKLIADSIHNRQNLTLSISIREQLLLHYYFVNNLNLHDFTYFENIIPGIFKRKCEKTSWIKLNGTKYESNMVVLVNFKDGIPSFGKIIHIFLSNCNIGFLCLQLNTPYFDRHYYGHRVVESTNTYCFINYSDMFHYSPSAISTVAGEFYIVSTYDY